MTFDQICLLVFLPLIPAWALLVCAPHNNLTRGYVHSGILPIILSLIYVIPLTITIFFGVAATTIGGKNLSLFQFMNIHPMGSIAAWIHIIILDLFVGAWIGRDAVRRMMPRWATTTCLIAALIFGPIGLAFYFILRRKLAKTGWEMHET